MMISRMPFNSGCWRRLLRVPWIARRSNQSILKDISPKCSLEGLMLKLKLQYFGHLMWTADSLEKTLMLAKIECRRRRGWQRMRRLDDIINWMDMGLGGVRGLLMDREAWPCCSPWGCKESDTTECLNNNKNHPVAVGFLSLLNCFTMFCHFLLYSKVSYMYTYIQSF